MDLFFTVISPNKIKKEEDIKKEVEDNDLKMPSELFDCNFETEKNFPEVPSEFYFESDHEALRGNSDYHKLLKTYSVLQAKKIQAIQDVENLLSSQELALKNPLLFLSKFNQEMSKLNQVQNVPELPEIDWEKYKIPSVNYVIQTNMVSKVESHPDFQRFAKFQWNLSEV